MTRVTTLVTSEMTAMEWAHALTSARLLLAKYTAAMEAPDRSRAAEAYAGLQSLLDALERGLEPQTDALPVDCWQRPFLADEEHERESALTVGERQR